MGAVQLQPLNMTNICKILVITLGLSWQVDARCIRHHVTYVPNIRSTTKGLTTEATTDGTTTKGNATGITITDDAPTEATTTTQGTTAHSGETTSPGEQVGNCRAAPAYSSYTNMDGWCKDN